MERPKHEVADIFRRYGEAWRERHAAHLSTAQRRVMTAIELCRTAALGGHVERCEDCAHTRVAYNSCRNRHCVKCQWSAAEKWLAAREAELLPVPYFHVVFTLPSEIGAIAYQNKAKVYGLLFSAAAEAMTTIAADRKHLGAAIGVTAVLHTWGQNLDHHPHVHCIVPGGGIALAPVGRAESTLASGKTGQPKAPTDGSGDRWVNCRPGFFLSVRVLSRLFRRLFLEGLAKLHAAGELQFFGDLAALEDARHFADRLAPLRRAEWVVYAKEPFAGPSQVLAYLARYTHRVAISNRRLVEIGDDHVAFRWKDYRQNGRHRAKVMRLEAGEFMRRFLMHVLPDGFHRIRHYGLFANGHRAEKIALCRTLLDVPPPVDNRDVDADQISGAEHDAAPACPCCGGRMRVIEMFERGMTPRSVAIMRFDTS
jgi:hypothetical protein